MPKAMCGIAGIFNSEAGSRVHEVIGANAAVIRALPPRYCSGGSCTDQPENINVRDHTVWPETLPGDHFQ